MSTKYLSLFDFLGKAAGPELGKQVAEAAVKEKIKIEKREISNNKYTGKIMLYPEYFLFNYFNKINKPKEISDKDLPF